MLLEHQMLFYVIKFYKGDFEMAQYKENSTITFEKDIEDGKNTIRVSRRENDETGEVAIDVRRMYTDDNGELQFTQKGVRVSVEVAKEIIEAMEEALEEQ